MDDVNSTLQIFVDRGNALLDSAWADLLKTCGVTTDAEMVNYFKMNPFARAAIEGFAGETPQKKKLVAAYISVVKIKEMTLNAIRRNGEYETRTGKVLPAVDEAGKLFDRANDKWLRILETRVFEGSPTAEALAEFSPQTIAYRTFEEAAKKLIQSFNETIGPLKESGEIYLWIGAAAAALIGLYYLKRL